MHYRWFNDILKNFRDKRPANKLWKNNVQKRSSLRLYQVTYSRLRTTTVRLSRLCHDVNFKNIIIQNKIIYSLWHLVGKGGPEIWFGGFSRYSKETLQKNPYTQSYPSIIIVVGIYISIIFFIILVLTFSGDQTWWGVG